MQESKQKSDEASSAYGKLKDTISQQERELSKLKNQYTNVVLEQGKNSNAAKDLGNKIKNLSGDLQSNKNKLGEAERSSEKVAQAYKGAGNLVENTGNALQSAGSEIGKGVENVAQEVDRNKKDTKE